MTSREWAAGKFLVIGDIHGCYDELLELLDGYAGTGDRQIISLGDVVDRGPYPGKCVELLRAHEARIVLGNHEEKHFRYRRRLREGGELKMQMSEHHIFTQWNVSDDSWEWLEQRCEPYIELPDNVVAIHAGVPAGLSHRDADPKRICRCQMTKEGTSKSPWANWTMDEEKRPALHCPKGEDHAGFRWWTELSSKDVMYVYGHTVFPLPMGTYEWSESRRKHGYFRPLMGPDDRVPVGRTITHRAIGIDTGCVFGGSLTGLLLPEWELVSVPAKKTYFGTREVDVNYRGDV